MRLRLHLVVGLEAMLTRLHLLLPQQPTQSYACEVPTVAGAPGPKETLCLWGVVVIRAYGEWCSLNGKGGTFIRSCSGRVEDCDVWTKTPRTPSCPDARGFLVAGSLGREPLVRCRVCRRGARGVTMNRLSDGNSTASAILKK